MKKLNKNFYNQKGTVEAMTGSCSYYGCDCAAGDCVCNNPLKNSYDTWKFNWDNYTKGFQRADF